MNKLKSSTKKLILVSLILSFSFMMMVSAISLAAYTNSRYAQRTVSTYLSGGDRFSSNYLAKKYSRDNVKTAYTTSDDTDPTVLITLCNYEQGKQSLTYETDISYTLSARLVKYDAGTSEKYVPVDDAYLSANSLTDYKISIKKGNGNGEPTVLKSGNLSASFSGTLTGNRISYDTYRLTLDVEFATDEPQPNLYIEMVASVPEITTLPTLRAVFKAELRSEGAVNAWTGAFSESTEVAPKSYEGYNYRISGMGSGTVTLRWDGSKLELNQYDLIKLNQTPTQVAETSYYEISFDVNSDIKALYDLQFFKKNIDSETWLQMNGATGSGSVVEYGFTT